MPTRGLHEQDIRRALALIRRLRMPCQSLFAALARVEAMVDRAADPNALAAPPDPAAALARFLPTPAGAQPIPRRPRAVAPDLPLRRPGHRSENEVSPSSGFRSSNDVEKTGSLRMIPGAGTTPTLEQHSSAFPAGNISKVKATGSNAARKPATLAEIANQRLAFRREAAADSPARSLPVTSSDPNPVSNSPTDQRAEHTRREGRDRLGPNTGRFRSRCRSRRPDIRRGNALSPPVVES
jgi:hypothetical protein